MRFRVKVCGLRDAAALEAAVDAGADAVGFVLAPSPRRVTPAQAATLAARVPTPVARVLVFRDPHPAEVLAALERLPADAVQGEGAALDALGPDPGVRLLAVERDGPDLAARLRTRARGAPAGVAPVVLVEGARSGAGVAADWDRVADAAAGAREVAPAFRLVLSGGLTPDNVGRALARVRPFGVDVSSGVETSPGVKDAARVVAFLAAVRAAERAP